MFLMGIAIYRITALLLLPVEILLLSAEYLIDRFRRIIGNAVLDLSGSFINR